MIRRAPHVTIIERLTSAVLFALIIVIAAAWDALARAHCVGEEANGDG